MESVTERTLRRSGRVILQSVTVPAWPVIDLYAFRCPSCGVDEVWDIRTDEWWTLDETDYGPGGSSRPLERQWSGGLFDLLPAEDTPDPDTTPRPT